MIDLYIFLRNRLVTDSGLKELFGSVNHQTVSVIQPDQRTAAKYPRIIADIEEEKPETFGENDAPSILNGRLRIEIVTRQETETCPDAVALRLRMVERCRAALLGAGKQTLPVKGETFKDADGTEWNISQFYLKKVRNLVVIDPLYSRGEIVFCFQICCGTYLCQNEF